jgi:hypothetical protein
MEAMRYGRITKARYPDSTPVWSNSTPYKILERDQIRLLQVHKSRVGTEQPLTCSLSTHDLSNAPTFMALSYTWGVPHRDIHELRTVPASSVCEINCNGQVANIGENLHDFLIHCAFSDEEGLRGYLWVDALCINQSDITERGEQVKLMGDIYQAASGVYVWLGPEDSLTKTAIGLMHQLLQLSPLERQGLHPGDIRECHPNLLLDSGNWQALAQFFQRAWFNRAWYVTSRYISCLCLEILETYHNICGCRPAKSLQSHKTKFVYNSSLG